MCSCSSTEKILSAAPLWQGLSVSFILLLGLKFKNKFYFSLMFRSAAVLEAKDEIFFVGEAKVRVNQLVSFRVARVLAQ